MAIEQGIWKSGDQPQQLKRGALTDKALLIDMPRVLACEKLHGH